MARCDSTGAAGSRCRAAGEAHAGIARLRSRRDLHPPRPRADDGDSKHSTRPEDVPEEFYQARKKLGDEAHKLPQGVFGPFINDEYSDVTFALYSVEAP